MNESGTDNPKSVLMTYNVEKMKNSKRQDKQIDKKEKNID